MNTLPMYGLALLATMMNGGPGGGGGDGDEGVVNTTFVGHWDGFGGTYADVWADDRHAYLGHFGTAGVDIVDIANPSKPVLAAAYQLAPPNDNASAQDVKVANGLLFIALEGSGNSAQIVDVRVPSNPVALVDIAIAGFTAIHNVFYADGYLYLADSGTPRVAVVDLTDFDPDDPPTAPITEVKWWVDDVGTSFVHDVTVTGGRMYASAWDSGVWIYDVTEIATQTPRHLGNGPGDNTHSCWPTSDGAYVITGEERPGGGIVVYRITDNGQGMVDLTVTDAVALPLGHTSVHNQVTIGYRVYNSWYLEGLRVFDVDPVTGLLEFVAGYQTTETGSVWGVYPLLGSDRVLFSSMGSGLWIVSVDLPNPGDVDGDGAVGFDDVLLVLSGWGPCSDPGDCPADLNGDGVVGFADLLLVLSNWSA